MEKQSKVVEKRNVLNEMRETKMTLQEIRFFTIFLAKINPRDENTSMQEFSIDEFSKIMGIVRPKQSEIEKVADDLMRKIITTRNDDGEWKKTLLFDLCHCYKKNGSWYIRFEANKKMMPLLFGYKKEYFRYNLWNALNLKSANQIRMYEILKQYEKIGIRTISIEDLKQYLGIQKNEYRRFDRFRQCVIDIAQEEIKQNTDIRFDYKMIRHGRGGKVTDIEFTIKANENHKDPLLLEEFINMQNIEPEIYEITEFRETSDYIEKSGQASADNKDVVSETGLQFMSDACDGAFTEEQMEVIRDMVYYFIDGEDGGFERYHYLRRKYHEMTERQNVENPYKYLKKMIMNDMKKAEIPEDAN